MDRYVGAAESADRVATLLPLYEGDMPDRLSAVLSRYRRMFPADDTAGVSDAELVCSNGLADVLFYMFVLHTGDDAWPDDVSIPDDRRLEGLVRDFAAVLDPDADTEPESLREHRNSTSNGLSLWDIAAVSAYAQFVDDFWETHGDLICSFLDEDVSVERAYYNWQPYLKYLTSFRSGS